MKFLLRVPDLSQSDHEDYSEGGKYGRRSIYREDAIRAANLSAIEKLRSKWMAPKSFVLASDTELSRLGTRYLLPTEPHDLFTAAIKYSIKRGFVGDLPLRISIDEGFLSHRALKALKYQARPRGEIWPHEIWKRLLIPHLNDEYFSNHFVIMMDGEPSFLTWSKKKSTVIEEPFRNQKGKKKPEDFYDALHILLETKWPKWEAEGEVQKVRAAGIAKLGIYPDMNEDNLVKIWRQAGFK